MPLIFRKTVLEKGELAIWKISETPEALINMLKKEGIYADIPFFRNPARLAEWLTARVLMAIMGIKQKIVYSEAGKPYLDGANTHISISHSKDYVAVIAHPLYQTGIDIEKTGDRIQRVSHKFVNDAERSWLSKEHENEQLYVIWGAKECAFKIFGLGEIDFKDHLEVEPFEFKEQGITRVRFKKEENDCIYQVFFQYLDQTMITYAFAS
jgi:4'-phosphopantetheinyl transferase